MVPVLLPPVPPELEMLDGVWCAVQCLELTLRNSAQASSPQSKFNFDCLKPTLDSCKANGVVMVDKESKFTLAIAGYLRQLAGVLEAACSTSPSAPAEPVSIKKPRLQNIRVTNLIADIDVKSSLTPAIQLNKFARNTPAIQAIKQQAVLSPSVSGNQRRALVTSSQVTKKDVRSKSMYLKLDPFDEHEIRIKEGSPMVSLGDLQTFSLHDPGEPKPMYRDSDSESDVSLSSHSHEEFKTPNCIPAFVDFDEKIGEFRKQMQDEEERSARMKALALEEKKKNKRKETSEMYKTKSTPMVKPLLKKLTGSDAHHAGASRA